MTQYFEYLSPLRMVHTECYCRHHWDRPYMHNVVQPHDHVYILLDDNDPKQGFFRAYYNIISIRVCSKEATCYTTVESPYWGHHGTTAAVWIIEVSVFQRLPVYFHAVGVAMHTRAVECYEGAF